MPILVFAVLSVSQRKERFAGRLSQCFKGKYRELWAYTGQSITDFATAVRSDGAVMAYKLVGCAAHAVLWERGLTRISMRK